VSQLSGVGDSRIERKYLQQREKVCCWKFAENRRVFNPEKQSGPRRGLPRWRQPRPKPPRRRRGRTQESLDSGLGLVAISPRWPLKGLRKESKIMEK